MTELPDFRRFDVFAGDNALGNPAAVITLETFPEALAMQEIAVKLAMPATAFVELSGQRIRWFSPAREIALCGHGALAAGAAMMERGGSAEVSFRLADGRELRVRRMADTSCYEVALPALETAPASLPGLAEALGIEPAEMRWNAAGYALVVVELPAAVRTLSPDRAKLKALGNWQVSVSARSDQAGADIVSRVFSGGGIEDAATGSAHAAMATYWAAKLSSNEITAFQASERGGRLRCRVDGQHVWIGGLVRAQRSG